MNIKELRRKKGYSQFQLAKKVGVSQQTVAKWESGKSTPTFNKIPKIAMELNCKIEELFAEAGNDSDAWL